jgi:hypothetical protein
MTEQGGSTFFRGLQPPVSHCRLTALHGLWASAVTPQPFIFTTQCEFAKDSGPVIHSFSLEITALHPRTIIRVNQTARLSTGLLTTSRTRLPIWQYRALKMKHHLMVGTWTPPGAIFTVEFDDEAWTLKLVKRTAIPEDEPISWMTFDVCGGPIFQEKRLI